MDYSNAALKPVVWIGTSKSELSKFPVEVKSLMGFALYLAQQGGKHPECQAVQWLWRRRRAGGCSRLLGNTYRAVYTVRLPGRVYVLHSFQKKSKRGIETPKVEIKLIKSRLKRAKEEHAAWIERAKNG